jgi:hypothetical protein
LKMADSTRPADSSDWMAEIRELLNALDEHWPLLASTRNLRRRQFAAAGLARCRALLEAMCVLLEAERRDVVGVLARALAEAWLVSLYVLHKGKDPDDESVLIEVGASHAFWALKMVQKNTLPEALREGVRGMRDVLADRSGVDAGSMKLQGLNVADVALHLGRLLPDLGIGTLDPVDVYDRMIRIESLFGVHAGIGSFMHYLADDQRQGRPLIESRPTKFPASQNVAAVLTLYLARHVLHAFEIAPLPRLLAVEDRIHLLARELGPDGTG